MPSSLSVTPFIAETTTTTLEFSATGFTSSAACSIRAAPSSDVPPNLKATISLRQPISLRRPGEAESSGCKNVARVSQSCDTRASLLRGVVLSPCAKNAGTKRGDKSPSADDSDWTFLAFMVPLHLVPLERLWRGVKEKTHRQVRFGGGFETFGIFLVSSLAVSGNRLRRSRNNRRRRRGHALSGERKIHTESENSMAEENGKVKV